MRNHVGTLPLKFGFCDALEDALVQPWFGLMLLRHL